MLILENANNLQTMILHEQRLNVCPKVIGDAVYFLHAKVNPLDVLLVASNQGEFEAAEQNGKAKNTPFVKSGWAKIVAKNQGVVLVITNKHHKRPMSPQIAEAWSAAKEAFEECNFELLEVNGSHVVFFIGVKVKKEKPAEIGQETAQILTEGAQEGVNHE